MKLKTGLLLLIFVFEISVIEAIGEEPFKAKQTARTGEAIYQKYCSICHGSEGRGDGHAAFFMSPKPRDFSRGSFKLRSTLPGQPPLDSDLFTTVTKGMHGSLMPSFEPLSEQERKSVVAHIKTLAVTEPGGKNIFTAGGRPKPIVIPPEPRVTRASLARGKDFYKDLGCGDCHGNQGKGDGPSAKDLKDQWGYAIQPTDLTAGVFKGGAESRELYKRTATGMDGTPMPAYGDDVITGKHRWALVQYVQSLSGGLAGQGK
ncbi:MAG: c-type cytochrome [Deltaproteobacteria bacterium]|nr:c-type cytochrome [Deltaproteobacteria bacterium]